LSEKIQYLLQTNEKGKVSILENGVDITNKLFEGQEDTQDDWDIVRLEIWEGVIISGLYSRVVINARKKFNEKKFMEELDRNHILEKDCPNIYYQSIMKYKTEILEFYKKEIENELERRGNPNFRRVR